MITRRRIFRIYDDRTEFVTVEEPAREGDELLALIKTLRVATEFEEMKFEVEDLRTNSAD